MNGNASRQTSSNQTQRWSSHTLVSQHVCSLDSFLRDAQQTCVVKTSWNKTDGTPNLHLMDPSHCGKRRHTLEQDEPFVRPIDGQPDVRPTRWTSVTPCHLLHEHRKALLLSPPFMRKLPTIPQRPTQHRISLCRCFHLGLGA